MRFTISYKSIILFTCIFLMTVFYCGNDVYAAKRSYVKKGVFPDSYISKLDELHKRHPNWMFSAIDTGLDWKQAHKKMSSDPGVNTIWYSYAPSYFSVVEGRYNYLTDTYKYGSFKAASKKAIRYFMDPRNFFDEKNIFMFEDKTYSSYQKKSVVKKVVKNNKVLAKNAKAFVEAGKKYDISPVYLGAKSYSELGTSTFMINGHSFSYGGKRYSKCYNAYNIGSSDSRGVYGGLIYANGGRGKTSYGRKWNSVAKAIKGGAMYLKENYIDRNQASAYTEHFNVLNGPDAVGTHIYMSSVTGAKEMGSKVSGEYENYGIFDEPLEFSIPVYRNMPEKPSKKPSDKKNKDNNYYLKELKVKGNKIKTLIKSSKLSYKKTFSMTVPYSCDTVTVSCKKASRTGGKVTGAGEHSLAPGENTIKVVSKSSSGEKRTYKINIKRA